ncbi:MAG: hypothetical protein ABSH53_21665 [Holophaga sp.]|jgi:hypothetical protein
MSVTAASAQSQSIASLVLQQLLSGSNSQATAGLSPSVLQEVLQSSGAAQTSSQGAPAAVAQALGDLLSGSDPGAAQTDLATVQSYFKQNPDGLANLLSVLRSGSATYNADGTLSSSTSLLSALEGTSGSGSTGSILATLLGGQAQDPLLASLSGSSTDQSGSLSLLG